MRAVTFLTACLIASTQLSAESIPGAPYSQTVTQNGTTLTLDVKHLNPAKTAKDPLQEFENVSIQLRIVDGATKSPLSGNSPAAWIDRRIGGDRTTQNQCAGKVKRLAEGSTFSHTDLELTSYFVVMMNSDETLTVVDPRFGYGDTRLLAMISLHGPGEDWALTDDGKRLFVSVPSANEVVAVETAAWKTVSTTGAVTGAARVALQPDGAYLWVAYGVDAEDSGVAVLNAQDMRIVKRIQTGRGYHHMAFTADSSFVFVTNPRDGTVSVIDIRRLARVTDIPVGAKPTWIAYSDLAKAAYVANEGDGKIVAIDAVQHKIRAIIDTSSGLGQIRFAPGGRFALAVNPSDNMIYVVDASTNHVVQRGKLENAPDQIAFTNKEAHIRQRGSDSVLMIALESLGKPGTEISVADFSGGRHPPGAMSLRTPADGVVQALGENGVLVANPGDKSVYFYMEGSAAPMGNLSNYGREPRAVLAIDRSLREHSPGVYETTAKLPAAGSYDFAVFVDRPRMVSCFDFPVGADPALARTKRPKVNIESRVARSSTSGQLAHVAFRLTFADTGKPDPDAKDVLVLMAGPLWQDRQVASYRGDGIYTADFKVPTPGSYRVLLSSRSQGLSFAQYATIEVAGQPN
jgi:YVTN family beta-propeller protein